MWAEGSNWEGKVFNIPRTCCAYCSDCNSLALLDLLCLYHATNLHVYRSTGLDITSHFGQAIRGPQTLDLWPLSTSISWKNFLSEKRRQV